jgi:3-oxoacyl-[acyl-carrier-protein] synthase-3
MDGPELVKFSLDVVPQTVDQALTAAGWTRDDVEIYLMHQATAFLLNHLRDRMSLNGDQMPVDLEEYGNTVSSTIPILIDGLRRSGQLKPGTRTVMIGFGVGLSWAGCTWTETWKP